MLVYTNIIDRKTVTIKSSERMEEQQKLIQKEIFDHISKNDISGLKAKLISFKGSVDFTDENGN